MSELRVIIAGGGTGGHIYPAIAIGHALQRQRPGTRLLFVGANGKMEMEKVPKEGFDIVGLDIAGFDRSNMLKNITLPFKLLKSRMKARSIIKDFGPDAIVGVGGFASFPILHAGQGMGVPTLIQEQNSYAGKSNKILGRKAKAICVAYEGMDRFFPAGKLILTGNPVRKNIAEMNRSQAEGREVFALKAGVRTLLVVGGSLGARSVNETIDAQLEDIVSDGTQVLWQTGKPYLEKARARAAAFGDRVRVHDFITTMDLAYAAADVVISRAGALAIAELCIVGKPVIFVPYPHAAENHQESNAMALVNNKAALMVKDKDLRTDLVTKLKELMKDEPLQATMARNIKAMAIKDAADRIAAKVIEIAGK
ncbi:undecaprenyldiphospho-muramoylpentapeptide beta-N-acetylglucosaminyltransferase [Nemorincola caseinilytica]|uniref:UDP-N-acetylglucosamine--N-acetylmuramyl-(pentapeptide) pyrophosphoryl-undecaprenol N-acetylglucosamine transferase n=1 Tax=Nemorincola caseinilytica TaxID=2054315 RepID=A0ABP8NK35_9BACT